MRFSSSQTDLVEGASIGAATAAEQSCSWIAEALGARHGDLGLTDSYAESD